MLPELARAVAEAADEVRGLPPVTAAEAIAALGGDVTAVPAGPLTERLAPLLALVEGLPPEYTGRLVVRLLAVIVEPV